MINGLNDLTVPAHFNTTTIGHKGSGIEGGPSQPGLPKEAIDEADIQIWDNGS